MPEGGQPSGVKRRTAYADWYDEERNLVSGKVSKAFSAVTIRPSFGERKSMKDQVQRERSEK